jgi:hypothetical protein
MHAVTPRAGSATLLALTLAATLVVYRGVLGCFFWADDIVHLYDVRNGSPLEFVLMPYGGHLNWPRNALIFLLERFAGPRPEPFFLVVLATHLVNVALCFAVVRTWTGRALLAAVWATLWGTSPRNAVTLSWFTGHGQMVVATVMLLLAWRAGVLAARGAEPTARNACETVALCAFATVSFGLGLGVGLVVPFAALLLFPQMPRARRWTLLSLLGLLPLLYLGGFALNALVGSRTLPPSEFSISTVPTMIELIVLLLGNGLAGLLAGFKMTKPISLPVAYAAATTLAIVFIAAFAAGDGPSRRRLLAVALLPLAIYGLTGVGRASMVEFFGRPEPLAATPRYHYAGPLGLALLGALVCVEARRRLRLPALAGPVLAALVLAINASAWARSDWHVDDHAWVARRTAALLARVDAAAAAAPPGAPLVLRNERFAGVGPVFMHAPRVFPRFAALFIAFRSEDAVAGRPVRFAEADAEVYAYLTADSRKRIARLLVPAPLPP